MKKRKDNIISITQRENHHLPLTPVTLKKAIILNSSRHYLGCCAEQRSNRNKKKKQSTGTHCTLMTRKPIFSLNPLSYAQVCIYAWQALQHLRRTRFFMRSVYFSPFCFDALTNGISAFSRTSAKVYSLTSTPSSNTVWRRSCHKFKIRASQS